MSAFENLFFKTVFFSEMGTLLEDSQQRLLQGGRVEEVGGAIRWLLLISGNG